MNGNKMDKLPEGLREFLANLSKSEMMVLEEMADELEGDRFFHNPMFANTRTEGIARLAAQVGRIAQSYEADGDVWDMHNGAVKLMALAFRFALGSWEDDK